MSLSKRRYPNHTFIFVFAFLALLSIVVGIWLYWKTEALMDLVILVCLGGIVGLYSLALRITVRMDAYYTQRWELAADIVALVLIVATIVFFSVAYFCQHLTS